MDNAEILRIIRAIYGMEMSARLNLDRQFTSGFFLGLAMSRFSWGISYKFFQVLAIQLEPDEIAQMYDALELTAKSVSVSIDAENTLAGGRN